MAGSPLGTLAPRTEAWLAAMTLPLFFGCVLIAYGPSVVLFFGVVWQRAPLLLLACTRCVPWAARLCKSPVAADHRSAQCSAASLNAGLRRVLSCFLCM